MLNSHGKSPLTKIGVAFPKPNNLKLKPVFSLVPQFWTYRCLGNNKTRHSNVFTYIPCFTLLFRKKICFKRPTTAVRNWTLCFIYFAIDAFKVFTISSAIFWEKSWKKRKKNKNCPATVQALGRAKNASPLVSAHLWDPWPHRSHSWHVSPGPHTSASPVFSCLERSRIEVFVGCIWYISCLHVFFFFQRRRKSSWCFFDIVTSMARAPSWLKWSRWNQNVWSFQCAKG